MEILSAELLNALEEREKYWLQVNLFSEKREAHYTFLYNLLTRPGLDTEERKWAVKFAHALSNEKTVNTRDIFSLVCDEIGLSESEPILNKAKPLYPDLLILLLNQLRQHDCRYINLKYPTKDAFVTAYPEGKDFKLDYCQDDPVRFADETNKLWHTANTAAILFCAIPSKCNFTVAMKVVPKAVEGWTASYSTGGGQMHPTRNRAHIIRTEGGLYKQTRTRATKVMYEYIKDIKHVAEQWTEEEPPLIRSSSVIVADDFVFGTTTMLNRQPSWGDEVVGLANTGTTAAVLGDVATYPLSTSSLGPSMHPFLPTLIPPGNPFDPDPLGPPLPSPANPFASDPLGGYDDGEDNDNNTSSSGVVESKKPFSSSAAPSSTKNNADNSMKSAKNDEEGDTDAHQTKKRKM